MAEHVFSVLCSLAIIDQRTKQATIVEVIEKILITPPAAVDFKRQMDEAAEALAPGDQIGIPHRMWLVSWWVRSDYRQPEAVNCRVRAFMPNGEVQEDFASFIVDLEDSTGFRVNAQVLGIAWGGEGLYWVTVERQRGTGEWEQVGRIPLELELVQQRPATPEREVGSSRPSGALPELKPAPSRKPKPARRTRKDR